MTGKTNPIPDEYPGRNALLERKKERPAQLNTTRTPSARAK